MSVFLKDISWSEVKEIKHIRGCMIAINGTLYRADNYRSGETGARWKFFGKDFIVKVDDRNKFRSVVGFGSYLTQSKDEYLTYNKIHKSDRKWFTKPLFFDGKKMIVHQLHALRCSNVTSRDRNILERLMQKYDLGDIDPEYSHNWAFVLKDGKLVPIIYDYGWINSNTKGR